jgi:DNA-binding CsgD family transcriptional regulator
MVDVASLRPAAPFIGRVRELGRLQQLIQVAAAGNAAAVMLAGDAGVGKTSLIAEAARRAEADGLLVLLGRCVDLGTGALPYLPFAEAIAQLVRTGGAAEQVPTAPAARAQAIIRQVARERPGLSRIVGGAGQAPVERAPGDTGLDRLALFEAVAHVLGRIGDEVSPVLLLIEDLHWADASTRDLVRFLLARLGTDRLLVVGTYRGDDLHRRHPLRPLLAELLRLPHVERMELLPFGDDELADFLGAVHGSRLPDHVLRQISARSAGNAYYAEELLAVGADERLPTGLSDVLLDRLERLSAAGQQVVRVASVLGNAQIEDSLLRAAAGTVDGELDVDGALREAVAHQLLGPDGPDRYAFRHALLQEAVYGDLLPGERVRLHTAVADRLAALAPAAPAAPAARDGHADAERGQRHDEADAGRGDRVAAELARHSLAAHNLPLALAASLRAAAEAGRRSAPAQALAHFELALQLWDVVAVDARPPGRDPVEIALVAAAAAGDAGLHARAVALARSALQQALGRADSIGAGSIKAGSIGAGSIEIAQARAAVSLHVYATDAQIEAREQARRVVAELTELGVTRPVAARVLARSIEARVDVSMSEAEAALEVIPAALAEAEQLGLLGLQADLLTSLATAHGMVGRPGVPEQWAAARAAAERAGDHAAMIRVLYNTAIDESDRGDLPAAVELLQQGLRVAEAAGLASSLYGAQCRYLLSTIRWLLGDAEGALAVVEPAGQLPSALARQLRLFVLPVQAARDPEQVLSAAQWLVGTDAPWDNQILQTARAEAMHLLGRWGESAAAARQALGFLDAGGESHHLAGIAISTTAVAALADAAAQARERGGERGDGAAELQAIEAAQPFIDDGRERAKYGRPRRFVMGPEGLAWIARLEAEAARLRNEDDEAAWGQVAEAFAGVSVYEAARARWRRGELLLRTGRREEARFEAVAAREAAVGLGAKPLIEAIDELGRRARFELAKPADSDLLTPREQEVMSLVAEGLTNRAIGRRLFISEKTASVHVSHVLAKLGASGRAEAVAIIGRRGLID